MLYLLPGKENQVATRWFWRLLWLVWIMFILPCHHGSYRASKS